MNLFHDRIASFLSALALLGGAATVFGAGCGSTTVVEPPGSDFGACTAAGQCLLEAKGCCGGCGQSGIATFEGVNRDQTAAFQAKNCPEPTPCPACVGQVNPAFAAFCQSGSCTPIDVHTHAVSDCKTDADCHLRYSGCCETCIGAPETLIALDTDGLSRYRSEVCGPADMCGACAVKYPDGYTAVCGPLNHCEVKAPAAAVCPAATPESGTECGAVALDCEYGSDPRPSCRTHASCSGGTWQLTSPKCKGLAGPGENGCPGMPDATGVCTSEGLVCDMGSGAICACGTCAGGPCSQMPHWLCVAAPGTPAGCPAGLPDLGASCSVGEGATCVYGVCGSETSAGRTCSGGAWKDSPVACAQ